MTPLSLEKFGRQGEEFLLQAESWREAGGKVAGVYCTFAPGELIRAAGAVPVGLCGKRQDPIAAAERDLPVNLCPLIKSSYGYAITDTCPFFAASDLVIGETTCDGKKKMFELLARLKPFHLLHLPPACSRPHLAYWVEQLRGMKEFLQQHTDRTVEPHHLWRQMELHQQIRRQLLAIAASSARDAPLLTGSQMMQVMESRNFAWDLHAYLKDLQTLAQELDAMGAAGETPLAPGLPRVMLTGCPVGKGSDKVLKLLEEAGAVVVCQENCTSLKPLDLPPAQGEDPLESLAWTYLQTPCSCLTPNTGRFDLIGRLLEQYRVQGVVDLTWQCCHTYNIEAGLLRQFLKEERGVPLLHIETDYALADSGQLRTRVEAFLELIG